MERTARGFWHYLDTWRGRFGRRRSLRWRDSWLSNGYCRDCRYCCGPQDSATPFPMPLLPAQIRPHLDRDFYLLNPTTPYIGKQGCKSDTSHGCRLCAAEKPVACGLFPIVFANGALYLYQTCPAVLFTPLARWADFGLEAAHYLLGFSLEELHHLSLHLECETLARNYIDLHILLFDGNGKAGRLL